MDLNRATYEAFDGVEIRFKSGGSLSAPPFTLEEAAHYFRLLSRVDRDGDAHWSFLEEFPERVGILDVALADLGFECEYAGQKIDGWALTVAQGLKWDRVLDEAGEAEGWKARAEMLEKFPRAVRLEIGPRDVFPAAQAFREALYLTLYGLAKDFLRLLASPPRARERKTGGPAAGSSTRGSTT